MQNKITTPKVGDIAYGKVQYVQTLPYFLGELTDISGLIYTFKSPTQHKTYAYKQEIITVFKNTKKTWNLLYEC